MNYLIIFTTQKTNNLIILMMKKLAVVLMMGAFALASSCSKEKKITKSLWKGEGTWRVSSSSYAYYSMGTYNTSTGKYEDSVVVASGNHNGSTFVFEKFDGKANEGKGTFTTSDTTINFTYFVSKNTFGTGSSNADFILTIENDAPSGGVSMQEFYDIMSHDKKKMSLKQVNNSGWSTTPYSVIHSYVTIEMDKQ